MDDENFPVQCHPVIKPKKKKSRDLKNESVNYVELHLEKNQPLMN